MADIPEATDLLAALKRAKDAIARHNRDVKNLQGSLVKRMQEADRKQIRAKNGDESLTGTLVQGSTVKIDERRLKKALGAAQWNKVTKKVLDKDLLEAAIAAGEVDPAVVAGVSEEVQIAPYIKITSKPITPLNKKKQKVTRYRKRKVPKP